MAIRSRVATDLRFSSALRRVMSHSRLYPALEYGSLDVVKLIDDDFGGDTLNTFLYGVSNGGGNLAVNPVIPTTLVVNGVIEFVTGDAGGSTASSDLNAGLTMRGDHGAVVVACLTVDIVTGVKIEMGFTDATGDAGAVNVRATPTFNANDCALFCLDTDDNGNWEGVAANNQDSSPMANVTGANAIQGGAFAPVAATYEFLMVELVESDDSNSECAVQFSRYTAAGERTFLEVGGGANPQGPNSNVLLTPWLYVEARNGSSKTMSVDYFGAWQYRTAVQ